MLTLSARVWACNVSAILKLFPHRNLLDDLLGFHLNYPLSIGEETLDWGYKFVFTEKRHTAILHSEFQEFVPVPLPLLSQLPPYI